MSYRYSETMDRLHDSLLLYIFLAKAKLVTLNGEKRKFEGPALLQDLVGRITVTPNDYKSDINIFSLY